MKKILAIGALAMGLAACTTIDKEENMDNNMKAVKKEEAKPAMEKMEKVENKDFAREYFEERRRDNLVKTQYYRWYQVYEKPFSERTLANQKDLLDENLEITRMDKKLTGRDNYFNSIAVYEGWQNAHHVQNVKTTEISNGKYGLEADILYQNIRPNGEKASYTVAYEMEFETKANELPVLTKVNLKPTGQIENPEFDENSYAVNRAKSFTYYWLYNLENLHMNPEKIDVIFNNNFKEIITEDVTIDSTSGTKVEGHEGIYGWLKYAVDRVKLSGHSVESFEASEIDENTIEVSLVFDWRGVTRQGDMKMRAKTQHSWILYNDVNERFARLQTMKVKELEPFRVVEE